MTAAQRRGHTALCIALILVGGAEAIVGEPPWMVIPPDLAVDRPSWRNFQAAGGGKPDAWSETMVALPGLEIPDGLVDVIPTIPFVEAFMRGEDMPSLERERGGGQAPDVEATPTGPDFQPLSEVRCGTLTGAIRWQWVMCASAPQEESRLMEEGQRLWDGMVDLRERLIEQPGVLDSKEGARLVEEFDQLQSSFEVHAWVLVGGWVGGCGCVGGVGVVNLLCVLGGGCRC